MTFSLEDRALIYKDIKDNIAYLHKNYGFNCNDYYKVYNNIEKIYDYTIDNTKKLTKDNHGLTMLYIANQCYDILKSAAMQTQKEHPKTKFKIEIYDLTHEDVKNYYQAIFMDANEEGKDSPL